MHIQQTKMNFLLKLTMIVMAVVTSLPSLIEAIEGNDLIFYINPSEKIAPLEEYERKYYWNEILAVKTRHEDLEKSRKEHRENINIFTRNLCEQFISELFRYDKSDYWKRKLINHCIRIFLNDNLGKTNCTLETLSKYIYERLDILFRFRLSLSYNKKWLLDESEIIRIKKHYDLLKEYWLEGLLIEHGNDRRNIFNEYGISYFSQGEILYPITDREKEHLDIEVGNIVKLALALKDLTKADPNRSPIEICSLEHFSVRMFLERKGWTLEEIKKASDMSKDLDKDGFSLYHCYLSSYKKQWCWEKYQQKTIWGWLIWFFYGDWID